MKILQINSVCGYGSTGRIATDLYDVLDSEGHECCIAYGRGTASEKYSTIKIGNKLDFYSHVLKTRLFDLHGFGSKKATRKFINQVKEYEPDIILLHNIHGYYINIEILFKYLSTICIPVVWLLHDAWSISGHSAHFDLSSNNTIPENNIKNNQKAEYPKSYLIDNSRNNFLKKKKLFTQVKNMTIITPSNWLAEIVKKSFLSMYNVKVIHNGIDLSKFKPIPSDFKANSGLTDKKILLGVASVWNEKKGITFFNQLATQLGNEFKIILIGIEKNQITKINRNILAMPRTNNIKTLVEIYTASDIFLNPTLEDNFPTTNIEALACGTPVITFDTGGSSESLTRETGVVVEKENFQFLYDSILNFKYQEKTNEKCRKQAENFGKFDVYNEYLALFHLLIKN